MSSIVIAEHISALNFSNAISWGLDACQKASLRNHSSSEQPVQSDAGTWIPVHLPVPFHNMPAEFFPKEAWAHILQMALRDTIALSRNNSKSYRVALYANSRRESSILYNKFWILLINAFQLFKLEFWKNTIARIVAE